MTIETLVKGDIVLPTIVLKGGAVGIEDGRIVSVHEAGELPSARRVFDFEDHLVLPGAIDPHVHAYSVKDGTEGIERVTRGAAVGGVTTVFDMPFDRPNPVTNVERLRAKKDLVGKESVVDVALYGTTTKYDGAKDIVPLAYEGVAAFKFSTYESDPGRFPEMPDAELAKIFVELRKVGLVAAFHAENGAIIDPLIEELRAVGADNGIAHCLSRPLISETTSALKLLEFARVYQARLHFVHLTSPQAYEAVRWYKAQGVDVSAETCLHYLILTEDALTEKGALAKCNPPLRDAATLEDLWARVRSGEVDFVTSDHAPTALDERSSANIFDNTSGLPGVEYLLPLFYDYAVNQRNLPVTEVARLLAAGPAKRYGLSPRKGSLLVGSDADIAVLDPTARWVIDSTNSQSVARWSPYDGLQVTGKVVSTFVRGQQVFGGNDVLAEPGYGKFVAPLGK